MATTIHIPKELLGALDRKARKLRISRNRLIVECLERALAREREWSEGFFEKLTPLGRSEAAAVDEMLDAIRSRRKSGRAPTL